MLGLYLHIPFCQSICSYCNFNRGLLDGPLKTQYVDALAREIRATRDGRPADTIFFGGGTPSLLEPEEIGRLIETCRATFDVSSSAEITLETNPETATAARLAAFREAGVTRLSFGVQSFDDRELKRLGRIHTADRAAEAVRAAKACGFSSVSFDLMMWLPEQSHASWCRTVNHAIELAPDHLSLYMLELYPNAPLKEEMARAGWSQTPDDDAAEMYLAALEMLDGAGYVQYEISNVARPGHQCRHNLKYWHEGQWYGFGCGAHGTVDGHRWKAVSSTTEYIARVAANQSVRQDERTLSAQELLEEAVFLGLRMSNGIDRRLFVDRHGVDPWLAHESTLAPMLADGLLWDNGSRFGLTRRGMLVANDILSTFV